MGEFECVIILNPNMNEFGFKNKIIGLLNNEIINYECLGIKKLAYEIQKYREGKYVIFTFITRNSDCVPDLERQLRISNEVLKFIVVKKE